MTRLRNVETQPLYALRLHDLIVINTSCLHLMMSCRRFGPDLVAKAIVPDFALISHVAPPGMVCNTGNQYNDAAFVGE